MKPLYTPNATDAEQAVLGGLMLEPSALAKISGWLTEDDFHQRAHRLIFRAIAKLCAAGTPLDAVTLGDWLEGQAVAPLLAASRTYWKSRTRPLVLRILSPMLKS